MEKPSGIIIKPGVSGVGMAVPIVIECPICIKPMIFETTGKLAEHMQNKHPDGSNA
jgi:hypothetical protein